jgi:ABC-type nickel/cobalt efflux system permease component RcnA
VLVIPSGVIATCFALVCFAAAIIVGLAAGNDALTVLWRSLLIMLGAWLIGRVVGAVAQRALDEHLETYRQQHPLPSEQQNESAEEVVAEPEQAESASSSSATSIT